MSARASDDDEQAWWSGHEALLLSAEGADAAERDDAAAIGAEHSRTHAREDLLSVRRAPRP
jgi:hypothetical protein